ncbi:hypothetical protein [Nocardia seriolae]|uniref:hypothetical protein n=1 Tax=Nocardia seriolae TaxID=37332 RepID=UPI00055B19DE|nr:hypothetical protein [Nocardia seriolae]BEK93919.1 hypothetical protein NSER024013_18250 [Nocardia seriolae]
MTTGAIAGPGRLLALGRESARELVQELAQAAVTTRTGVLRVTGEPGGDLHVVHGLVVTVDSPGAPGVRELLARPGRTTTGAAELEVVAMMAAIDGCFAIASGWIGSCFGQADPPENASPPEDPVCRVPGIEPGWLLHETERRLCALAQGRVSPHRNHLRLTERGRLLLSGPGSGERREILLWANGRRSCRDISMLLCRSLYAVTVEVARMLEDDLLAIVPVEAAVPALESDCGASGRSLLPRRRRGASGINDMLPPRPPQPALRGQRTLTPRRTERTQ